jgi:prepilin-type N-terminal cleavage/methylation domain-containing protein
MKIMIQNKSGFTLVELIIVMAVFITVLMISASAFNTILVQASKLFRSEESNIEGVIGLEMLRHDLQQSGYGLFSEPATYADEAEDTPASDYNDAPNNVPRPIVVGEGDPLVAGQTIDLRTIMRGSDYLAIKGTSVGREKTAQKWTFLNFSSGVVTPKKWASAAENLTSSPAEKVVLIRKQFSAPIRSSLVRDPSDAFYYSFSDTGFNNLSSATAGIYTVYGVDTSNTLRFPFNRSDYFVARPSDTTAIPAYCAHNTGILYKTTVNQADGKLDYIPVLDCVLDMQVVLGWDWNSDGIIDTYSNADGTLAAGLVTNVTVALSQANNNSITTLPNIRSNLKMVKVYILAQNGKKDLGYTSASPLEVSDTGETSLTRPAGFPLAADQLNYRWKLYRIVVRPKNLLSNQ